MLLSPPPLLPSLALLLCSVLLFFWVWLGDGGSAWRVYFITGAHAGLHTCTWFAGTLNAIARSSVLPRDFSMPLALRFQVNPRALSRF
jgi:hypothetical protein